MLEEFHTNQTLVNEAKSVIDLHETHMGSQMSELEKDQIRWDTLFRDKYPGKHVAYLPKEIDIDGEKRLLRRVLKTDSNAGIVSGFIGKNLSEEEQESVRLWHEKS